MKEVDSLKSDEISQDEKKISDLLRCEESRIILSESLLKSSFGVGPRAVVLKQNFFSSEKFGVSWF